MKKPTTWKEILAGLYPASYKDPYDHNWVLQKITGGKKFFIRRSDNTAEVNKTPKFLHYKCSKCGIYATDCGNGIVPNSIGDRNLTCDEVIIKDIII